MFTPPRRRLTPEQQALASDPDALELAARIAERFGRRAPPLADEFEAEALLALAQAAATFDPAGGACFRTHATARLIGAMLDTHRHWTASGFRRREANEAPIIGSLLFVVDVDERGWAVTLGETLAAAEDPPDWGLEYQDELEALSRRLSRHLGPILRMLYGRCELTTTRAVGRETGLGERRIGQLRQQAVGCLANGRA